MMTEQSISENYKQEWLMEQGSTPLPKRMRNQIDRYCKKLSLSGKDRRHIIWIAKCIEAARDSSLYRSCNQTVEFKMTYRDGKTKEELAAIDEEISEISVVVKKIHDKMIIEMAGGPQWEA